MAMIKCPECGKEVSEKAPLCPNCGYPINPETRNINNDIKESKRASGKVFLIMGILCWVGFFIYRLSIADDYLSEKTFYVMNGYYRTSLIPICRILTPIMEWGGLILIVLGIVIMIVHRKK